MRITKKVGEIASIQAGNRMRGTIPHVPGSGVFMIQPKDIDEYGRVNWWQVTETELTGRAEPRWLEPGDVIFRMNGKANLATYIDRVEVPGLVVCSHQFFHLKLLVDDVAPEYLAWFINTPECQEAIARRKQQAGIGPVVNKGMLSDLDLVLIDKSIQWQVVDMWHEYLAERRLLENQIAGLESAYRARIRESAGKYLYLTL